MNPEVNTLLELDRLEVSRLNLECAQASLSSKISEKQSILASALADLTDKKNIVEASENALYAFSGRVIMDTGRINRLQSLSLENVSQKEYETMQAELLTYQERIRHSREEQSRLRGTLPSIRAELEFIRADFDRLEEVLLPEMETLKTELAECIVKMNQTANDIVTLRDQLPVADASAWALCVQSRAALVRKGDRTTFLSEMSLGEDSCKFCFVNLPKQFLVDLSQCNSYLECPNCGCFLVFNPKKVVRK